MLSKCRRKINSYIIQYFCIDALTRLSIIMTYKKMVFGVKLHEDPVHGDWNYSHSKNIGRHSRIIMINIA